MKKAIDKPLSIVLIIIILTFIILPLDNAVAADFDFVGGRYKLTVVAQYNTARVQSINIGIYRVATALVRNGKVEYTLVSEFSGAVSDWPVIFDSATSTSLRDWAIALRDHATQNEIKRMVKDTDSNGIAEFENLQEGIYLVMQERTSGTRYRLTPTLVAIPTHGQGTNVIMAPKVSRERESTPTPTPTPTPIVTPTPTPTPTEGPNPSTTPGEDVEITLSPPPTGEFPPDNKPPTGTDDLPTTGVVDFQNLVIFLVILGILLLVVGIIQNKRSQKNN